MFVLFTPSILCKLCTCGSDLPSDTLYPKLDNKSQYIACPPWGEEVMTCAMPNTWFCYSEQRCVWPSEYEALGDKCLCKTSNPILGASEDINNNNATKTNNQICGFPNCSFSDAQNGKKFPTGIQQDYGGYYLCLESGEVISGQCPSGLYFQYDTQNCINPIADEWLDICNISVPISGAPALCGSPKCKKSNSTIIFPSGQKGNCSSYYGCTSTGSLMYGWCESGLCFDYNLQRCTDPAKRFWNDYCCVLKLA